MAADLAMQMMHDMETEGMWWLAGGVVMPNHVHLIVRSRGEQMARLMQLYKGRVARAVNVACGQGGRFWQAGYHDAVIRDEQSLLESLRYCVANPVRAGLVLDWRLYPYVWTRWPLDEKARG